MTVAAVVVGVVGTVPSPTDPSAPGGPGQPPDAEYPFEAAIRERVTVSAGRDDDGDGTPDEYVVDVVRPDTDEPVPVIMIQSPYWDYAGRGRERETRTVGVDGVARNLPLFYDNWFVPRGYAVVALDTPGQGGSGGCDDNFGPATVASTVAALDWLDGSAAATGTSGESVAATWSSGNVGMIGKSADGSMAVSAAATGHRALKAVVPIAGVTASLDRSTGGGLLTPFTLTADLYPPSCADWAEGFLDDWGDGFTYTDFWAERDPLADPSSWTAATLIANGFQDINVPTSQSLLLWEALGDVGAPRQLFLYQAGHTDPFDIDRQRWVTTLTRFFDHYLRGDDNGVEVDPPVTVQHSDGSWSQFASWPNEPTPDWIWDGAALVPAASSDSQRGAPTAVGVVARRASDEPAPPFEGYVDFWLGELDDERPDRVVLLSTPLAEPLLVTGDPEITVSLQLTGERRGVAATLLDVGDAERIDLEAATLGSELVDAGTESCWGASSPDDDACYHDAVLDTAPTPWGFIASGGSGIVRTTVRDPIVDVADGEWITTTIPLGMADTVVPAGHRLAVVFTAGSVAGFDVPVTSTVTVGSDLTISFG